MAKTINGREEINRSSAVDWPGSATVWTRPGKAVYVGDRVVAVLADYELRMYDEHVHRFDTPSYLTAPNERRGLIVVHSFRPHNTTGSVISNHRSASAWDRMGHIYPYQPTWEAQNPGKVFKDNYTQSQRLTMIEYAKKARTDKGQCVFRLGIDVARALGRNPYLSEPVGFPTGWVDGMHAEISWRYKSGSTVIPFTASELIQAAWRVADDVGRSPTASTWWKNARGPDVEQAQKRLNYHGFDAGVPDGSAGPKTDGALRAFQKARRLEVDGKVGPITLRALNAEKPAPPPIVIEPPKEDPKPEPTPVPEPPEYPKMDEYRIAGPDRRATSVAISRFRDEHGINNKRVLLATDDAVDATVAWGLGHILYVKRGSTSVPQVVLDRIKEIEPVELLALGDENAVTDAQLAKARDLVGLPLPKNTVEGNHLEAE